MQFEKKALIKMIKKKYIKIVFLEALNNFIGDCLRINSLIHKKNVKNSGYNFLISPLINEKLNKSLIDKNKVFINLGV